MTDVWAMLISKRQTNKNGIVDCIICYFGENVYFSAKGHDSFKTPTQYVFNIHDCILLVLICACIFWMAVHRFIALLLLEQCSFTVSTAVVEKRFSDILYIKFYTQS